MTRDRTLLGLEIRLLVARYGKARVVKALSTIDDVDLAGLHDDITGYERKRTRSGARRRPRRSIEEMVREANPPPASQGTVERLARAYDERDFLPELRDVRRFLEARGVSVGAFRSRSDALPTVLRVLAQQELEELTALDKGRSGGGSDLGVITDQILRSRE